MEERMKLRICIVRKIEGWKEEKEVKEIKREKERNEEKGKET
jgi:hypothetical protein